MRIFIIDPRDGGRALELDPETGQYFDQEIASLVDTLQEQGVRIDHGYGHYTNRARGQRQSGDNN